jgi:hypothetical protein
MNIHQAEENAFGQMKIHQTEENAFASPTILYVEALPRLTLIGNRGTRRRPNRPL